MKQKTSGKKIRKFSMKLKMTLLSIVCIAIAITAILTTTLPRISTELKESTEAHMNDFVVSHQEKIVNEIEDIEEEMNTLQSSSLNVLTSFITRTELSNMEITSEVQAQIEEETVKSKIQSESVKSEMTRFLSKTNTDNTLLLLSSTGYVVASNQDAYIGTRYSLDEIEVSSTDGEVSIDSYLDETSNTVKIVFTKTLFNDGSIIGYLMYISGGSEFNTTLNDYTLTKIPAPRLYILDKNGLVLCHVNSQSVGTTTTNPLLVPVLEQIRKGTYTEEGAHNGYYNYEGGNVSVSYIHIPETDWILGVNVLDTELYKDTNSILRQCIISSIFVLLGIALLLYYPVARFTKPIENISKIIRRIGQLDFSIDVNEKGFKRIVKRNDEVGDMGKSVEEMINSVKNRIQEISDSSVKVKEAAFELKDITTEITEKANDTSATTEELSAGMEETTATTDMISVNVNEVQNNLEVMKEQITQSAEFTVEIMKRADKMTSMSMKAEQNTRTTFDAIKERGALAMEQSKETAKINEFVKVIMDISEQTSLLALNASIEAARAGESGRGFAVVADQIGNLAQQSSNTVSKISEIVNIVNEAVQNITICLSDSQNFVEENVYRDYADILRILETYNQDASKINVTMNEIDKNSQALFNTMQTMTESIQGISQTIQEAAVGVSNIAEKNSDIGSLMSRSNEMVIDTNEVAQQLEESVTAFKLS